MPRGAPIGNKFWMLRSRHGIEALFTVPSKLWEAAVEYFDWADENTLTATEFNGKDAIECEVPKMRAMTIKGLCLYLGVHDKYFFEFRDRWTKNKTKKDAKLRTEFLAVIARIEQVIFVQKFEGAAAGLLSHAIIARELGLVDKTEQKVDANINGNTTVSGKVVIEHRSSGIPLGDNPSDEQDKR